MSHHRPTLHLLHGFIGTGKTTLARRLAAEHRAVRLSDDEWMVAMHGTNPPEALFRPQQERIHALIWEQARRVLEAGTDVVLENGFWTRAARDAARRRAGEWAVNCLLYELRCPPEVARARTLARTSALPAGTLEITAPTFERLWRLFEPLADDEPRIVIDTGRLLHS